MFVNLFIIGEMCTLYDRQIASYYSSFCLRGFFFGTSDQLYFICDPVCHSHWTLVESHFL